MKRMLDYTRGDNVTDLVPAAQEQTAQLDTALPTRSPDSELYLFSKVNFISCVYTSTHDGLICLYSSVQFTLLNKLHFTIRISSCFFLAI